MNDISQTALTQSVASGYGTTKKTNGAKEDTSKVTDNKTAAADGKTAVKGAGTYGDPKLSKKGLEYYNQLKKKYGNMNFVLVAEDKKQEAEANKASFSNANSMTVLIDTDKIEKMAEDPAYRAKIEGVISNSASGINQLKEKLGSQSDLAAFGMTIDKDGKANYYAVIDKNTEKAIKKAQEKKAAKKKADKKVADKKLAEKKKAEKLKDKTKAEKIAEEDDEDDSNQVTITAGSIEELMDKIQTYQQNQRVNQVQTAQEKAVGQSIDYTI